MSGIYLFVVIVLVLLAVFGLFAGVSNDATNFLNSANGSKAASRRTILTVASIGIIIGAISSNGMMEVARSGMFNPELFTFHEVMILYLGVMFANMILLDIFNTLGMPTSTTVSLVFSLLGAAIAIALIKIGGSPEYTSSDMGQFIKSGRVLIIISAILVSVVVAFIMGTIVMFVSRLLFTFRYKKIFARYGALWCGVAFAAIFYFVLFKGVRQSGMIKPEFFDTVSSNLLLSLLILWAAGTALSYLLQLCKVNILKVTILAGTFSLALSFAGNDLVNFIGVPIAGIDSYKIALNAGGNSDMLMTELTHPAVANHWYLLISGVLMAIVLWVSNQTKVVGQTEINLAKQDEGSERFGSSLMSRVIVRGAMNINHWYQDNFPQSFQRAVSRRFIPTNEKHKANFDLIRAAVNLTTASIVISIGTSFKIPLSTTYVTFMVAMGSSFADKAWGRESAVYRITGVITVIAGWFMTALIALIISIIITALLMWGGIVAVIIVSVLSILMMIRSQRIAKRKREQIEEEERENQQTESTSDLLGSLTTEICNTMQQTTQIYQTTIVATLNEDRKTLRNMVRESNDLFYAARERKYAILPTLQKLQENYINTGQYYVQVVDYMSEMTKALVHITRPCFEHIDNNHRGMNEDQVTDLLTINTEVAKIYDYVNRMLQQNNFEDLDMVLMMRDNLFDMIAQAIKNQLRRIKTKETSTKASMLYLTILNETKTMVLQSRNLLKSQKCFFDAELQSINQ